MTGEGTNPPAAASADDVKDLVRAAKSGDPAAAQARTSMGAVREDYAQDVRLKKLYGWSLLAIMVVQLGVADAGFFLYASRGVAWRIEPSVMHVWLGATVVEVIGIVLVVTRYLFPRRDRAEA